MIAVWRVVLLFSFFSAGPAIVSAGRYGVGRHRSREDAPSSTSVREISIGDSFAENISTARAHSDLSAIACRLQLHVLSTFLVLCILCKHQIRAFLASFRQRDAWFSPRRFVASRCAIERFQVKRHRDQCGTHRENRAIRQDLRISLPRIALLREPRADQSARFASERRQQLETSANERNFSDSQSLFNVHRDTRSKIHPDSRLRQSDPRVACNTVITVKRQRTAHAKSIGESHSPT